MLEDHFERSAGEQDEHHPRTDRGGSQGTCDAVADPPPPAGGAQPACRSQLRARLEGDRGHGGARAGTRPSESARKKAVSAAMREVAEHLGNTPAIARSSYTDPRVIDRFLDGETIDAATYRAAERSLRGFLT